MFFHFRIKKYFAKLRVSVDIIFFILISFNSAGSLLWNVQINCTISELLIEFDLFHMVVTLSYLPWSPSYPKVWRGFLLSSHHTGTQTVKTRSTALDDNYSYLFSIESISTSLLYFRIQFNGAEMYKISQSLATPSSFFEIEKCSCTSISIAFAHLSPSELIYWANFRHCGLNSCYGIWCWFEPH